MTQQQFDNLFARFKKVAYKYLTEGVAYKQMTFSYPDGSVDYVFGFCLFIDGKPSFHQPCNTLNQDYQQIKVNDIKTLTKLINRLRFSLIEYCIVKNWKYVISRVMADNNNMSIHEYFWNGRSFILNKNKALLYNTDSDAFNEIIGKYKERYVSAVPIF